MSDARESEGAELLNCRGYEEGKVKRSATDQQHLDGVCSHSINELKILMFGLLCISMGSLHFSNLAE